MAPLSPSNTKRFYYTYANSVNPHTFVLRVPDGATTADADALVAQLLSAIGGQFSASLITSVEVSAKDSDFRFPIASARLGDTFGTGSASVESDAIAIGFVGRSTAGRRMRLFLFGWIGGLGANYRISSTEMASVGSAITALGSNPLVPLAIDGFPGTWKSYANVKPNDHWVKAGRS